MPDQMAARSSDGALGGEFVNNTTVTAATMPIPIAELFLESRLSDRVIKS